MSRHKHHGDRAARRNQFVVPQRRRPRVSWNAVIVALGAVFFGVILLRLGTGPSVAGSSASNATQIPSGHDLAVPATAFADGQARFYRYTTTAGRSVNVFVIKSSDGVIRAALDACTVCYRERKGYHQEGDVMVCNNCGKAFRSVDVNVITGGCNPIPLERGVDGGQVIVRNAALESGAVYAARALVNKPALVLADEPTGCLDSRTGHEIVELFLKLRGEGVTLFMVTHDAAIAHYADCVVTLEDDRLTACELAADARNPRTKECV